MDVKLLNKMHKQDPLWHVLKLSVKHRDDDETEWLADFLDRLPILSQVALLRLIRFKWCCLGLEQSLVSELLNRLSQAELTSDEHEAVAGFLQCEVVKAVRDGLVRSNDIIDGIVTDQTSDD